MGGSEFTVEGPDGSFPRLDPEVLVASAGVQAAMYEPRGRTVHVLNPSAAQIVEACAAGRNRAGMVAQWAATSGLAPAEIATQVDGLLGQLAELGLLAGVRAAGQADPTGSHGPDLGTGAVRAVVNVGDLLVGVVSPDDDLVAGVVEVFGDHGRSGSSPAFTLTVTRDVGGGVAIAADGGFATVTAADSWTDTFAVVAAVVARAPETVFFRGLDATDADGRMVVLTCPYPVERHRLFEGLPAHGWRCVGAEIVGVDVATPAGVAVPLPRSGGGSASGLSGPVRGGALAGVVMLRAVSDGEPRLDRLRFPASLMSLEPHLVGLAGFGQAAFDELVRVSAEVPVFDCTYPSLDVLVELLATVGDR